MRHPARQVILLTVLLVILLSALMTTGCSAPNLKASDLPDSIRIAPGNASGLLGKIRIESYRPARHGPDDPILIVMHGAGRNADDYRDAWVDVADEYNIMIIAPEFSENAFSGFRGYNLGNMEGRFGGDRDRDEWALSFVQPIFEAVVSGTESHRASFDIFGHSAGGQFVHRLVLFSPEAQIDHAVAANSGWYTLPTYDEVFPYGLDSAPGPALRLNNAFARKLTIMLGELDNSGDDGGNLRTTKPAMRQGEGRLQRGEFFAAVAEREAAERTADLSWRVVVVPGVGHEYREMARAAARYLYGEASDIEE